MRCMTPVYSINYGIAPSWFCLTFAGMKILMVCLGNICRSPLAEAVLKHKADAAGLSWVVDSAGTNGYHIGDPPHPLSRKVAAEHGLDISMQRARQFLAADVERFDRIYAMGQDVVSEMRSIARHRFDPAKIDLLMNVLYPGQDIEVPDPWSGPESGYHLVYRMVEEASSELIKIYGSPS